MDRRKLIAALAGEPYAAFGTGSPGEEAQKPSGLAALFGGAYNALGDLSKRAFGASETMRNEGTYNPAPMVEAAMLPMGTGAVAGVPMRAGEAVLGAGPIRAYHGSPYDFDQFAVSKIGTGEGAQAYGHGLYFAENEKVAKSYRDALATVDNGKMYEVNIKSDPTHMLDWDKPLRDQPTISAKLPEDLQQKIKQSGEQSKNDWGDLGVGSAPEDYATGQSLYKMLQTTDPAEASNYLKGLGVPGIKYFDQASRTAGEGSRNYVVFDDNLVEIMRKYGLAGLPAAGVAYGAAQDQPRGLAAINTQL